MIKRYIKRSTGDRVEAVLLTRDNIEDVARWCSGQQVQEIEPEFGDFADAPKTLVGLNVPTPDGNKRVSEGQYVVHSGGDYFAAKYGSFHARFELDG